jgi:cation diffusion facilitator CzcD-associated flavoprotein CzcO
VFHSSDAIDFARLEGGAVGVLGAGASAFDNAAVALEAGVREVRLFSRRPQLPQINKSKWAAFPGFFHGFRDLDDALKWEIYTYLFAVQTPPPHESVLRCDRHAGFALHFAEPWLDVVPQASTVTVITEKAHYVFDAVVMATGFSVDLSSRPELARVKEEVLLWRDRVPAGEARRHPQAAHFPYLGRGFELIERTRGAAPGLGNIHCFNWGVTLSHGAMAGDIPGVADGVDRLTRALSASLFAAGAPRVLPALAAHDDRELEPTRYFMER